jgi:hypothetical protein
VYSDQTTSQTRGKRSSISVGSTVSRLVPGPLQAHIGLLPGALYWGLKQSGREADHTPPSSANVKNAWGFMYITPFVFLAW